MPDLKTYSPICPLCGAFSSSHFDTRTFHGQVVTNRICNQCGLVFQHPHLSDTQLKNFYQSEYRQLYQGQSGPTEKDLNVQVARAQLLLSFARPYLPALHCHLDIGCSTGNLLEVFRSSYNNIAAGVEPGDGYRIYARQRGLDVFESLDALCNASCPVSFDLISMAHVLEHLPNPVDYLAMLRSNWLEPGGQLLLEVPNLYAHDCFEVAHLFSFSEHTLTQVVNKAGFEVVVLEKYGLPRSSLIPLYIRLIARPSTAAGSFWQLQPEKNVALKRRTGMLRRRIVSRLFPARAWLKTPSTQP